MEEEEKANVILIGSLVCVNWAIDIGGHRYFKALKR